MPLNRIHTLLIANRGEIVNRVARTARAMGIRTITVYSDADANAPYLQSCDVAAAIGGERPADSYLSIEKLLNAAQQSGAQAIHPGYGFLSENADFAQAVMAAGLLWVGPPVAAMRAMGDKAQSRQHMQQAGVPVLPGSVHASTDLSALAAQALTVGFPLMVKASAGGGGRGMRLVLDEHALPSALQSAFNEAQAAFGDGRLLLERALLSPRHVEVQLLADSHGHVIHLGERDCTVQRRHQKLIEEAPSPAVNPALRRRLGDAAVKVATAVQYVGAGTVEFLLDTTPGQEESFYFMEMNTRLQVEHPVTEALINEDLVAWQLRIAMGEHLSLQQEDMLQRFETGGHTIEVRLCAEDTSQQHMPQSGRLHYWQPPAGLRCDAALASGMAVSPFYDSMLGKLIAHAPTRESAIHQLADGLERTVCLGLNTNRSFLAKVLRSDIFASGRFSTSVVQQEWMGLTSCEASKEMLALAAFALTSLPRHSNAMPPGAWWNWRSSAHSEQQAPIKVGDQVQSWRVQQNASAWTVTQSDVAYDISDLNVTFADLASHDQHQIRGCGNGQLKAVINGQAKSFEFAWTREGLWLQHREDQLWVQDQRLQPATTTQSKHGNEIWAPMHGRIVKLHVADGDEVKAGQLLLVMEAMKMEHHLNAPKDGVIKHVAVQAGVQVALRQSLIHFN
jgi:geranyl-CoA carboxylase alpha subunit